MTRIPVEVVKLFLENVTNPDVMRSLIAKDAVRLANTEKFRSLTGRGVIGKVEGPSIVLGNLALLQELAIDPAPLLARAEELRRDGHGDVRRNRWPRGWTRGGFRSNQAVDPRSDRNFASRGY